MNVDTSIKSGAKNESSISVATHIYFMVAGLLSDWILSSKITLNFIGKSIKDAGCLRRPTRSSRRLC